MISGAASLLQVIRRGAIRSLKLHSMILLSTMSAISCSSFALQPLTAQPSCWMASRVQVFDPCALRFFLTGLFCPLLYIRFFFFSRISLNMPPWIYFTPHLFFCFNTPLEVEVYRHTVFIVPAELFYNSLPFISILFLHVVNIPPIYS